ncbi:MAG: BamA/TamA family outer membrane protein [Endomicrobiales bacterium]
MVVLTLVLCVTAPSRADAGGESLIASIQFHGVKELSVGDIKKAMDTQVLWVPLVKKPRLDEGVLKNDMKNIETYYQANGFFDATASYAILKNKKNTTVRVLITVNEGRPSIVDKISISTHAQTKALISKLTSLVTVERQKRYQFEKYEESKKKILQYLNDNGYGAAAIVGKALVNKLQRQVEIVYTINEGPLQKFGPVTITGNETVQKKDIIAELVFKTSDTFSGAKVEQSRTKIFNLGVFRVVSVHPVVSSSSTIVPITIDVVEGDKRQIRLGIGYATEAQLRTSIQWSRYYLWGRPRTLTLEASDSAIDEAFTGNILQPYFLDRKNSLTLIGSYDKQTVPSFTDEKTSFQLQVKRNFQDNFFAFAAYNLEVNKLDYLPDTLFADILAATPGSSYFIASLSGGLNYTHVDNIAYPTHGYSFSLYEEPATFLLGSQFDYLKSVVETHFYGLLTGDVVIAMRTKIGYIAPSRYTTDVPIYKRFFSGGGYSVRGYGFDLIGPQDTQGNPIGGDCLYEENIEIRYPIVGKIKGVAFIDSGAVYATSFYINSNDLNYGVGTGFRYVTPIGPVGIDLAFPVQHYLPINWGSYNLYFTIGQGF